MCNVQWDSVDFQLLALSEMECLLYTCFKVWQIPHWFFTYCITILMVKHLLFIRPFPRYYKNFKSPRNTKVFHALFLAMITVLLLRVVLIISHDKPYYLWPEEGVSDKAFSANSSLWKIQDSETLTTENWELKWKMFSYFVQLYQKGYIQSSN